MNPRLLTEAEEEAQEAARWYDNQQPGLGSEFLNALAHALETIETAPRLYGRVACSDDNREVRRCALQRFPFVVFYEIRSDEILILAVAHQRRRPNYWMYRSD